LRHTDLLGEFADRPLVGPALDRRRTPTILDAFYSRIDEQMINHPRIERIATLGGPPSFAVEDIGNSGAIETFVAKLCGARRQRRVSAE